MYNRFVPCYPSAISEQLAQHIPPAPYQLGMDSLHVEQIVWDLIVPHLRSSDRPAARLTCSNLAAAVDAHPSTAITQIRVTRWQAESLHTPASLQHSIYHLEADISSVQDWCHLHQFLHQLPQLSSLTCTGRRTWPPKLQTDSSSSVQPHVQLRAVGFNGFLTSLVDLSQLAPNLETLSCQTLVLQGASSGASAGSLPSCRFFGADSVAVTAQDEVEAHQAFAQALPQLQVLTHMPAFTWGIPTGSWTFRDVLPLQPVLQFCSSLQSIRAFGSSTAMGGLLPRQLQDLPRLQRLSVYGVGPAVELFGISSLTRLTALSLSFELPAKRAGSKLLSQLASLPKLQQLALPVKLLCSKCCPGGQSALELLLNSSSEGNSAPVNAAAADHNSSSSSSSATSIGPRPSPEHFPVLQQLVFLCRPKSERRRYQCGDFCKHLNQQELEELTRDFAAAVGGLLPLNAAAAAAGAGPTVAGQPAGSPAVAASAAANRPGSNPLQQQNREDDVTDTTGPTGRRSVQVVFALLPCEPPVLSQQPASRPGSSGAWGCFGPPDWFA